MAGVQREWQTPEDESLKGEIVPTDDALPSGGDGWEPPAVPDVTDLERGDPYEGPRRGFEFSVDATGTPFRTSGDGRKEILNEEIQDVAPFVRRLKGGGSVTITEANHMVTMTGDGPVFLGVAPDPDDLVYDEQTGGILTEDSDEPPDWL